ncbi:hypothetical protein DXD91_14605 [Anaerobutyricum hallii]|uniref:Uncharacterized protein n=1 Tax=Anaerobutyricum hallii TaxID=39488 RepID=A0A374N318_9FIRM|nr:hypothetical protein DXD91_14605 [Anaerobutyricum hallii]
MLYLASGFLQKSVGFIQINIFRTKKSLYNLNMAGDIFTLSLNVYIYNEEKTGRIVLPNEIVMRQYTGGIYVKGHT